MEGQTDRQMKGGTEMDGQTVGGTEGWRDTGQSDKQMDIWADGWMNRQFDEWMSGQMD